MRPILLYLPIIFIWASSPASGQPYNYFPIPVDYNAEINALATSNERKAEIHFNEGMSLYKDHKYADSTIQWLKTLQLVPSHTRAKFYAELTYTRFQKVAKSYYAGEKAYRENRYAEALQYFNEIEKEAPKYKNTLEYFKKIIATEKITIIISTRSNGEKSEFTNTQFSMDDSTNLYSAGFINGKFIGNINLVWKAGTDPAFSSDRMELFFKHPGKYGKISISFFDDSPSPEWTSREISVTSGKLYHFEIADKETKSKIQSINSSVDNAQSLIARGFDKNGNFAQNVTAEWEATEQIHGSPTIYTNKKTSAEFLLPFRSTDGRYSLKATFRETTNTISDISILPGKPAFIAIEDKSHGGIEVADRELNIDETITLYAVVYDRNHNYIGLTNVFWSRAGTLNFDVPLNATNAFSFTPDRGNRKGQIYIAANDNRIIDSTGEIKTKNEKLKIIKIVNTQSLPCDKDIIFPNETNAIFLAAAFDDSGKFIKYAYAVWSLWKENKKILSLPDSRSFVFRTPAQDGTYILKMAYEGEEKYKIKIRSLSHTANQIHAADISGNPLPDLFSMAADEKKPVRFFSFNARGVRLKSIIPNIDRSSNIKITKNGNQYILAPLKTGDACFTLSTINEEKINILQIFKIKVLAGRPARLVIMKDGTMSDDFKISTNDPINFTVHAFDANNNDTGEIPVSWSLNDKPLKTFSEARERILCAQGNKFNLRAETSGIRATVLLDMTDKFIPVFEIISNIPVAHFVTNTEYIEYKVEKNNIMYEIFSDHFSARVGFKEMIPYMKALAEVNHIPNLNMIYPGAVIRIPAARVSSMTSREGIKRYLRLNESTQRFIVYLNNNSLIVRPSDLIIILDPDYVRSTGQFFKR